MSSTDSRCELLRAALLETNLLGFLSVQLFKEKPANADHLRGWILVRQAELVSSGSQWMARMRAAGVLLLLWSEVAEEFQVGDEQSLDF